MPFNIVRQDITKMQVDVVVNAANTNLLMGGGVCGAIFKVAGADLLQKECDKLSPIKTSEAVITNGFNLTAKQIIHVAGPRYRDGQSNESELLRASYQNALELAVKNGCNSIAFPLISSGIYGYPKPQALKIATDTIASFLLGNELDVYLTVFDKAAFDISHALTSEIDSFIDENYVAEHEITERSRMLLQAEQVTFNEEVCIAESDFLEVCEELPIQATKAEFRLDDVIERLDEPFSQTLLRLIDVKGKTDVEVYKKANIDRKLFSKIRTGNGYSPSKKTAVALAIALELTLTETQDLLQRAGYALSKSQKFDVIVEYFISREKYNIFEINEVLFYYDQQLLGG